MSKSNTVSPQCQFINKISLIILAVANQIALPQVSQHFVSNVMDALGFNGSEKKPALIVSSLLLASLQTVPKSKFVNRHRPELLDTSQFSETTFQNEAYYTQIQPIFKRYEKELCESQLLFQMCSVVKNLKIKNQVLKIEIQIHAYLLLTKASLKFVMIIVELRKGKYLTKIYLGQLGQVRLACAGFTFPSHAHRAQAQRTCGRVTMRGHYIIVVFVTFLTAVDQFLVAIFKTKRRLTNRNLWSH